MADQRDAWSEDISDRVLNLELQVKRLTWATIALGILVAWLVARDSSLPQFVSVVLLTGPAAFAVVVGVMTLLERRFPPK
jgi:hypothetical protein